MTRTEHSKLLELRAKKDSQRALQEVRIRLNRKAEENFQRQRDDKNRSLPRPLKKYTLLADG